MRHSHSSIKLYEQCPRKFWHLRVIKDVTEPEGEQAKYGTWVHAAFEEHVKNGVPLPDTLKIWESALSRFLRLEVECEKELVLDEHLKPVRGEGAWWSEEAWLRAKIDLSAKLAPASLLILDYKGLPLTTPLPTPSGWTTMGEVKVGDILFDHVGMQCKVVGKSEIKNLPCYEITFDDTSRVVCDEEHLWQLHDGRVVPVTELQKKDMVRVAAPLDLPFIPLPIEPYVLGLWLADGKHTSGEITKPDEEVWAEVKRRGYEISHDYSEKAQDGKCRVHTVKGLRTQLRENGLLGNKHIPAPYLRASYEQRLSLLQGLMDGDGSANATRGQAIFSTTDPALALQVKELLLSIGQRPLISKVTAFGFGKHVAAYPISFRPMNLRPFLLSRKQEALRKTTSLGNSWRRMVMNITPVPSQPTQCIAVDSPTHTFLCTENMVPTHNTGKHKPDFDQLELGALFEFAYDPELQVVVGAFVWTKHPELGLQDQRTYTRDAVNGLWAKHLARIKEIHISEETGNWPARPSGLCKWRTGQCAAYDRCPYGRR